MTPREGEVTMEWHAALRALLRAAYPHFPELFAGLKTWSYVRPEARVIGLDRSGAVATAGILRRFVQIGGVDQLVGMVGLVAVRPDRQGTGIGAELMRRVNGLLDELGVPFGLLVCAQRHVGFYSSCGWHQLPPRRGVYSPDDTQEARPFVDEIVTTAMVLPVAEPVDRWPPGEMHWHSAWV